MKVLLSAYACEPDKGSEPAVGWNWAIELAKLGHEVWVITRANNKVSIDLFIQQNSVKNIKFIYIDLPPWMTFWKRKNFGVHQYYFLWQLVAFFKALFLHKLNRFDIVHHVTFVSVRQPSFMGLLGIPFIFGPVAGGDVIPSKLRRSLPFKARLQEFIRDIINYSIRFDPLMHLTFCTAKQIYVNSEQTKSLVPAFYHQKISIKLAIGIRFIDKAISINKMDFSEKFLYVGHLLYLKGIHLALRAFAIYLQEHPSATFTIIGDGPQKMWLQNIACELGINSSIRWISWMPRQELLKQYAHYDLFIFPSLRDSGGLVILEAMSSGLPVVAFNLAGPGMVLDSQSGFLLEVASSSEETAVELLSNSLFDFTANPDKQSLLRFNSYQRAHLFSYELLVHMIYKFLA